MAAGVRYLVFDLETAADGALISKVRYGGERLEPAAAVKRYRDELLAQFDSDFIPYTFQFPVSAAIAKVGADFRLQDVVVLDEPRFRPHVITNHFWRGWERYQKPTLVSFNGRTFDLPMLELAAFRFGLSAPKWFDFAARTYEQPRNRFNLEAHIDLQELLTNFGSSRFTGGLNLAAALLGKPGKMDVQGHMVQDLFEAGKLAEINDYCRCDVLDTYFVFLRTRVILGLLAIADEQKIVAETKRWLEEQADESPAFAQYLERWGDWEDPWKADEL